jgi:hypothetical protein
MISVFQSPLLTPIPQRKQASFFSSSQNFLENFLQEFVDKYNLNTTIRNNTLITLNSKFGAASSNNSSITSYKNNIKNSAQAILVDIGIPVWQSGTTYPKDYLVYSSLNLKPYRAQKSISGTTDPSLSPFSDWKISSTRNSNWFKTRPRIALNFDRVPLLDKRCSFSRASIGSYINKYAELVWAPVNSPRFEYRGDGSPAGILIEKVSTNSLKHSNDFSQEWSAINSFVTETSELSPDPQEAWWSLKETSTGIHMIRQTTLVAATSQTFTFSVFVKAAERFRVGLSCGGTAMNAPGGSVADLNCMFNLNSGTIEVSPASYSPSIEKIGDYYRVSITFSAGGSGAQDLAPYVYCGGDTTDASYVGDTTKGILIFGAQLEIGTSATSYIETATSTVTRSADSLSMPLLDFGKAPLSVFLGMSKSKDGSTGYVALGSQNSELPWMRFNPFTVSDLGVIERTSSLGSLASTTITKGMEQVKFAAAISNDTTLCVDKTFMTLSTGGIISPIQELNLSKNPINGHIQFVYLWDKALPAAELKSICS